MKNRQIKNESQVMFFNQIKKVMPVPKTLVNEISNLLGIESDVAYRRIRGAQLINFEEALLIEKIQS